jgi:hypothetical protein
MPIIEEKLAAEGEVLFSPNGTSMLPTLKAGRDTLVLVSPPKRLRKYDIALFRRRNGQYVLHRVVAVGDRYTFIGDNQFEPERGIEAADIVALCTAYERNGKRVRLDSFSSRLHARILHVSRPLRRFLRRVRGKIKSIFKK